MPLFRPKGLDRVWVISSWRARSFRSMLGVLNKVIYWSKNNKSEY